MPLWGNTDAIANAPKYLGVLADPKVVGVGIRGNTAFNNTTPGAFQNGTTFGVFGVDGIEVAAGKNHASAGYHSGWVTVKTGSGGVATVTAINGSNFANGETAHISATGGSNASVTLTTNSTGNLVSASITTPGGGFVNVSSLTVTFDREFHLANGGGINVTGSTASYSNTDLIVASNGTVNAVATITTNGSGGFVNSGINIINVGLWANTKANTDVRLAVTNSIGGASLGTGASLVANLTTSSAGTLTITLGGHAGRTQYETLVAMSGATFSPGTDSENTVFPNS